MKIYANTIVHNEENFIWFALMSVVDYVDKILVWDTGSTDKTVEIIKEIIKIKGDKIEFKEVGIVDKYGMTKMRQAQLTQSNCDFLLILDGDEIWWEDSIKQVIREINTRGAKIEGIVVPMVVPVGDIYHLQDEKAGQYNLLGRKGHYNLRVINRKISGLHVEKAYPLEGYFDDNNKLLQERDEVIFLDVPYLHVTHLPRSTKVRNYNKFKLEMGKLPSKDFKYPEILYDSYPDIVSNPWKKLSGIEFVLAKAITPLKKIKRTLI
ncbi:MAG: glycosyltransferase [Candidatus Daviesbacteria bacterium]|nr:glycosyltransferase [Candidatus Daviesbacteria bacterium]